MTILKFRLVRNLSWMTLEHGFRMTVGVLVGAIVARYLGPAAYGTLNYASALVAICATLHAIVPEPLIIREIVADRRNTSDILGAAVAVRTVFALFAYVLLFAFPLLLPSTPEPYAIASYIIGVILFFQTTDVLASWFQAQQHSQPVVLSRLGGFFLSSILRLLLVWSGASMFSFAAAIAIESAITTLFILISVRLAKERPLICWPPAVAHVKTLLLNGWPLFLAAISATLYLRLDLVMIGIMKSDHETGLYSAATRISEIWYFIPMSLAVVVQPVLLGKRRLGGAICA